MEKDYGAAEEKRNEIKILVKSIIYNNTDDSKNTCFDVQKTSSEITDSLIEITSNEYENSICPIQITPPGCEVSSYKVITISEGFTSGAKSTKLGNIKLNLKKLCVLSSEAVFPIVAATHTPWLIPFAALVICNKFWSLQDIQITERDAIAIWTMWKKSDSQNCIEAEKILDFVNKELLNYARQQMNQKELDMIIKNLERIKCIEKTEENKWRLLEEIKINY